VAGAALTRTGMPLSEVAPLPRLPYCPAPKQYSAPSVELSPQLNPSPFSSCCQVTGRSVTGAGAPPSDQHKPAAEQGGRGTPVGGSCRLDTSVLAAAPASGRGSSGGTGSSRANCQRARAAAGTAAGMTVPIQWRGRSTSSQLQAAVRCKVYQPTGKAAVQQNTTWGSPRPLAELTQACVGHSAAALAAIGRHGSPGAATGASWQRQLRCCTARTQAVPCIAFGAGRR